MGCFAGLYDSNFLKNIGHELTKARSSLKDSRPMKPLGLMYVSKNARKKLYNQYVKSCGFTEYMNEIDEDDKDMLYALQEGPIVWLASKTSKIIQQSLYNSLYHTGDIPIYTGKQYINNKLHYVALYDLTFSIHPVTLN